MRVVHICQRDDPDTGGSLRVAEALVSEQRRVGVDAWLLFLYGPAGYVSRQLGTNTVCLGLDSSRQALRGIVELARILIRLKPDIIHSHDGITWPRLVFIQFRTPVVMHAHLPIDPAMSFLTSTLIRWTTDIIVGISLHTIETWINAGYPASRIHYVPNGVDFGRFQKVSADQRQSLRNQLGLPATKRIVLWVGRLHESVKGTDRVERMAALVPDNVTIVVVGNGPSFEGMCERCQPHVEAGKIIMVGSTSTPELYYKAADCFLFTSHEEAFGLVILEALATELPLIAFPVSGGGGAVQLLREFNAMMLDDSSSDRELCAAMEQLPERGSATEDNRTKASQEFSLGEVSRKVVDVYRIAMNRRI